MTELERAHQLTELSRRASRTGLATLPDDAFLLLLDEYRWAVGRLAAVGNRPALRAALNAAVLNAHGALHRRARRGKSSLGPALRSSGRSILISATVFIGSSLLAATAILGEPALAYSIVPRNLLAQIDADAWGTRGSTSADLGMTFFYWGNNLRASFLALGLGILGGAPALLVLGFNGALLGAVAAVAILRGASDRLLGWLAPHGVPELSALILCGAVGLELGRSWLNPGWHKRRAALADAGRTLTPLVVVAGVLVVCAAPLEGFVAPLTLPPWLDASIALGWILGLGVGAHVALQR